MTQGQIVTFLIIARCAYVKMAVRVGSLFRIGDPAFDDQKIQLVLCNSYMKTLKCYNPGTENNCLTIDDIRNMMNRVMQILGLCGDLESLTESDASCCDPLNGIVIFNP